jgi:hypothetical protein
MSYLRRLTATVAQPAPRLRPIVGSIFAGSWQDAVSPAPPRGDPSAASNEALPPAAGMPLSAAPDDPAGRHDAPASRHVASALPVRVRRADQPHPDTGHSLESSLHDRTRRHDAFRPLLPRTASELDAAAAPPDPAVAHALSLAPGPQAQPLDSGGDDAARTGDRAPPDGPSALGRGTIASLPAQGPDERAAPLAGQHNTRPGGDRAAPSSRPARGSDDIHIHIGRVEVTAAAPPAPRPPPPPARRTVTLEEYLGRRDRRA